MEEHNEALRQAASRTFIGNKIGIVTVTYNSGTVLPDFLRSLDQQSCQDFILIAVDNASSDDTLERLRASTSLKVVLIANPENRGVAAGNNQGIRTALAAGCEYVLLINNDVVFGSDLLSCLLSGMDKQACDLTTPMIYFHDEPTRIWAAGGDFQPFIGYRVYHNGENEIDSGQYDHPQSVRYAPTCCVLIREKVFRQIGLMDERYFVYSDDVDFMYRVLHAGFSMFLTPKAKLWHKVHSLTGGKQSDFVAYYGPRGRILFICKHLGVIKGTLWTWFYLTFYWIKFLVGRDAWHLSAVRRKGVRSGRKQGLERFVDLRI